MRAIDADNLISDLKGLVSTIKNIRSDGQYFLTEENVLDLINSQKTLNVINITDVKNIN